MAKYRIDQNECPHSHMELIGDNAARCKNCGIRTPINHEAFRVRACRKCGCTDADCSQCIEATGEPCHWVEPDLCSRCADELKAEAAFAAGDFRIPGQEAAR